MESSSSNDEISLNIKCNHCNTSITNRMYTLKFGEHERFFCYDACRKAYQEKYGSRIKEIKNRHRKKQEWFKNKKWVLLILTRS